MVRKRAIGKGGGSASAFPVSSIGRHEAVKDQHPHFERTVLDNGVRVITEHIPSVRSISVGAWVDAGSRDETASEAGISHFIEHMVFKGTRKRRMHQIAQRMESVGGYLNAFTSKEHTCFYARALDEHLDRAVDTVTDLVLSPTFPEKELSKEQDVVIEEMKMYEDTPEELIFDRLDSAMYPGHPLGFPVIGYEDTVRSFTRDGLVDYLDRNYSLDRLVIAAAGNIRHARTVALVKRAVESMDRPPVQRTPVPIPAHIPGEHAEVRPIQQAHLVVGCRGYDAHDQRRAALSVLNTIVGGGMSSRLNQNIRERYGFCYSIYSFTNLNADTGEFGVYMGTDASKVERAKKLIFRELEKIAEREVSPRTLSQAVSQVKGSIMLGLENMGSRMMRIGKQELYYGRYFSLDEVMEQLNAVTAADLLAVARDLFDESRFTTITLLPKGD